ncbi:hypothetical protein HZ994_06875 [Akkermansiaceae bacterium]|nr:hypothetical protein HZ994_06875 [Akkermansiaceae bacterium]
MKHHSSILAALCGFALLSVFAVAASPEAPQIKLRKDGNMKETLVDLTPEGIKLEAEYTAMLNSLREEIQREIPTVDDAKQAALIELLKAELGSQKELAAVDKSLRISRQSEDKYNALVEQLRSAPSRVTAAERKLQELVALPDSDPAKAKLVADQQKQLESAKKQLEKLPSDVEKAKKTFENAAAVQAELMKKVEAAEQAGMSAKVETRKALDSLGFGGILASDRLDTKLAQFVVLSEGHPRFLAQFAQESPTNKKLLDQLLSDTPLMLQMLVADGAKWGKYGEAVKIYQSILQASPKAKEGVLQRLAVATSLEHAVPMFMRNGDSPKNYTETIDPLKRYLSFEKAFLAGELDPAFKDLTTWELTAVVDGEDPDEAHAWCREMMRSYRPDLIQRDYNDLRYSQSVDSEIQYTSSFVKEDRPELMFMQNVLANGGICGRRAFFGRFALKSFGIPTLARPEPGHATLVQWTPDGWLTYLGGDFGNRARVPPYGADMHFVATTQARENETEFMKVKRAQWIGDVMGEPKVYGMRDPKVVPEIWHAAAIIEQDRIADGKRPNRINPYKVPSPVTEAPAAERAVSVGTSGVITIPAVATKIPADNVARAAWGQHNAVSFAESKLGGMQLIYSRYGGSQLLEYNFEAPKAGKYDLTSRMASSRWDMSLLVSANGAEPVEMEIPFKAGLWETSAPVIVDLKAGSNTLTFARPEDMRKGIAIRDFTLTPVN